MFVRVQQFDKEVYVWSKLKHPNVLKLLGLAFCLRPGRVGNNCIIISFRGPSSCLRYAERANNALCPSADSIDVRGSGNSNDTLRLCFIYGVYSSPGVSVDISYCQPVSHTD